MINDYMTRVPMTEIIDRHWAWLQAMGYDRTPALEALMLVVTEVSEAAQECRYQTEPTREFGHELADIVLRVMGIAKQHNIDLTEEIMHKIIVNEKRGRNRDRII